MSSDPDAEPDIGCRYLLICRTIWYDPGRPDDGYSLGRIVVNIRPEGDGEVPFTVARLFAYIQLFGEPGEYDVSIHLVRLAWDELEGELPILLATWGPYRCPITGLDLVESHAFALSNVPFDETGVFEFRLRVDGIDDPLCQERLEVRVNERE